MAAGTQDPAKMRAGKKGYWHPQPVHQTRDAVCRILPHCAHVADMIF